MFVTAWDSTNHECRILKVLCCVLQLELETTMRQECEAKVTLNLTKIGSLEKEIDTLKEQVRPHTENSLENLMCVVHNLIMCQIYWYRYFSILLEVCETSVWIGSVMETDISIFLLQVKRGGSGGGKRALCFCFVFSCYILEYFFMKLSYMYTLYKCVIMELVPTCTLCGNTCFVPWPFLSRSNARTMCKYNIKLLENWTKPTILMKRQMWG